MSTFFSTGRGAVSIATSSYTAQGGHSYIGCRSATAASPITLTISADEIANAGGILMVKDEEYSANDYPINIFSESGDINGGALGGSVNINSPGGAYIFYSDSSGDIWTVNNVYPNLTRSQNKISFNNINSDQDLITFESALTLSWDGTNHQFLLKNADTGSYTISAYFEGNFIISKSQYPIATGSSTLTVTAGGIYLSDDGTLNTSYNMNDDGDGVGHFAVNYIFATGEQRQLVFFPGMRMTSTSGTFYNMAYQWEASAP